ncbi:hypothetical protein PoB_001166400 [Plakobranchus ocellatus]|uniref:Uncharacterized protein n=1 Tax=Plakobranchus ocellatus TaxID=259542 RepID=A0AAV3YSZ5_9GAST|nr:hypothetical protein PoB_001166400 [Plakobranchus ocellatus]
MRILTVIAFASKVAQSFPEDKIHLANEAPKHINLQAGDWILREGGWASFIGRFDPNQPLGGGGKKKPTTTMSVQMTMDLTVQIMRGVFVVTIPVTAFFATYYILHQLCC